jgi:1-deoxyxylulose-5-phosphate synthase
MTLEYRQLGATDLRLSSIGLGCVTFGREIDAAASYQVLDRAVEGGVNLLDTAAVYSNGASEEIIGHWLHERRRQTAMVVATKVSGRLSRENILRSVDGSLRRLGVDRVDLLQAHDWDSETPLEEILETFEDLIRSGKIHYGGCSNWPADAIQRALSLADQHGWHRLASVQPMYNLANREIESELLRLCSRQQIGVITYSPLGAGFLTGKYRRDELVPEGTRFEVKPGHQRIYFNDRMFEVVEKLRKISERTGFSMAQLALHWIFTRQGLTSVLIGARNPRHLDQAFDAMAMPLEGSILQQLDALSRPSNQEE